MNLVQPYSPEVRLTKTSKTYPDYFLERDSLATQLNPRALGLVITLVFLTPLVLCGFLVAWGWFIAAALPVVAFLSIFAGEPWALRTRGKEKMKYSYRREPNSRYSYEDESLPQDHQDNAIWQMLLTDIFDEYKMLGDKFKMSEWTERINELDIELQRQKQEEIERANRIDRSDYAKLAREMRDIMNNSLE